MDRPAEKERILNGIIQALYESNIPQEDSLLIEKKIKNLFQEEKTDFYQAKKIINESDLANAYKALIISNLKKITCFFPLR